MFIVHIIPHQPSFFKAYFGFFAFFCKLFFFTLQFSKFALSFRRKKFWIYRWFYRIFIHFAQQKPPADAGGFSGKITSG